MKLRILIISLIILPVYFNYLLSTNPNYTIFCNESCLDKEMAYEFCRVVNGQAEFYTKCTKNPNTEAGLTVYKPSIPLCYTYNDDNLNYYYTYVEAFDNNGNRIPVYNASQLNCDIQDAMRAWDELCDDGVHGQFTYTSSLFNCCIRFMWSNEDKDFFGNWDTRVWDEIKKKWSLSMTHKEGVSMTNCEGIDCSKTYVMFNQVRDWVKPELDDATGLPRYPINFFYNINKFPPCSSFNDYKKFNWYDFRTVVRHELGHIFGFNHHSRFSCDSYSGVMYDELDRNTEVALSDDDKCFFRKLYCCTETVPSVVLDDDTPGQGFSLYPNPANMKLILNISDHQIMNYPLNIKIINLDGITALENNFDGIAKEYEMDISSLHDGVYVVQIKNGSVIVRKKMLVIR